MRIVTANLFPVGPFFHAEEAFSAPNDAPLAPVTEFRETDEHYVFSFELPGVPRDAIDVKTEDGVLTVTAERRRAWTVAGREAATTTHFERSVRIPRFAESGTVEAHHEDGVLNVAFRKSESQKSRRIDVKEAKPGFLRDLLKREENEEQKAETVAS